MQVDHRYNFVDPGRWDYTYTRSIVYGDRLKNEKKEFTYICEYVNFKKTGN